MNDESQTSFPFALNEAKLKEFLTRWLAIEDEQDRLRDDLRLLKDEYSVEFPMRGVLTAVKIVRARQKLLMHPKEPMSHVHLAVLLNLVEQYITGMDEAVQKLQALMQAGATISAVDMAGRTTR